jgi:hypothetical protein
MKKKILAAAALAAVVTSAAPAEAGVLHGLVRVGKVAIRVPGSAVKAGVDGVKVGSLLFGLSFVARVAGFHPGG